MNIEITWQKGLSFETQTPSGHAFVMDAAEAVGGENKGPRPTEALLSAVGTCSGIDIVDILHKMRLSVASFSMSATGERQEEHPRKFTKVHIHYRLTGDLPESKVRRAIQLSIDKYCSVAHSMNAELTTSFELNGENFSS